MAGVPHSRQEAVLEEGGPRHDVHSRHLGQPEAQDEGLLVGAGERTRPQEAQNPCVLYSYTKHPCTDTSTEFEWAIMSRG